MLFIIIIFYYLFLIIFSSNQLPFYIFFRLIRISLAQWPSEINSQSNIYMSFIYRSALYWKQAIWSKNRWMSMLSRNIPALFALLHIINLFSLLSASMSSVRVAFRNLVVSHLIWNVRYVGLKLMLRISNRWINYGLNCRLTILKPFRTKRSISEKKFCWIFW